MTTEGDNSLQLHPPGPGRRYRSRRTVRLSDVLPSGLARLDAVARYQQDVAYDDGNDAGINADVVWVVRKSVIEVKRRPRLNETVELATWASGSGARWAARRTSISAEGEVDGRAIVEAASLWVCVSPATHRPVRLPAVFWTMYGDSVNGRTVSPRLTHPGPPADLATVERLWPLRISDLDVADHVNNAVAWAAVEDELDRVAPGAAVRWAEVEYRQPMNRADGLGIVSRRDGDGTLDIWLTAAGTVLTSARLSLD